MAIIEESKPAFSLTPQGFILIVVGAIGLMFDFYNVSIITDGTMIASGFDAFALLLLELTFSIHVIMVVAGSVWKKK